MSTMSNFVISPSSFFAFSNTQKQRPSRLCFVFRNPRFPNSNFASSRLRFGGETRRTCLSCNCCSKGPGDTGSNENENRSVLDAFFLGKALAEVINERIESTVGEVLGTIGRFQAEQQKQVQEIQEEVLERAKRAKERAAREAMEAQGLVASKQTTTINQKPVAAGVNSVTVTTRPTGESITISSKENLSGSSTDNAVESSSSSDEDSV